MALLPKNGVPGHMVRLNEQMYTGTWCQVQVEGEASEWFEVKAGVRQETSACGVEIWVWGLKRGVGSGTREWGRCLGKVFDR